MANYTHSQNAPGCAQATRRKKGERRDWRGGIGMRREICGRLGCCCIRHAASDCAALAPLAAPILSAASSCSSRLHLRAVVAVSLPAADFACDSCFLTSAMTRSISSTFLLARMCVPRRFLANLQARLVGLLPPPLCNNNSSKREQIASSRSARRSNGAGQSRPPRQSRACKECRPRGCACVFVLQDLHDALLIRSPASHLADDVADELGAVAETLAATRKEEQREGESSRAGDEHRDHSREQQ